jgi:hypothetical protein
MLCRWGLSNQPLKDLKFSFSILKINKFMVRRVGHFEVLVLTSTDTGRDFFTVK